MKVMTIYLKYPATEKKAIPKLKTLILERETKIYPKGMCG